MTPPKHTIAGGIPVQQAALQIPHRDFYPRRIQDLDRVGIVLLHWGGPSQARNVYSFLRRVYDDQFQGNYSRRLNYLQLIFSWLAAVSMREKVAHELEAIGGNCPAEKLIHEQAQGLEDTLDRRWGDKINIDFRVYAATQYAAPSLPDTAKQMEQDGIEHVILVPAYLQESNAGMQKSIGKWQNLTASNKIPQWSTYAISPFGRVPGVLKALSERIDQTLQRFPKPYRSSTAVIFCAPGIPGQNKVKFREEVLQVSKDVMQMRKEQRQWKTAFYGYYDPVGDYLRELKETVIEMAYAGNRCVMLLPLCGITENLQTTYSMDIACRNFAHQSGVRHFEVAGALNSYGLFLETLSDMIGEAVESSMHSAPPVESQVICPPEIPAGNTSEWFPIIPQRLKV